MVDAGDLKSPGQESCRFESCPGYHLVSELWLTLPIATPITKPSADERLRGWLQIQRSGPNDRADLVGGQQLLECFSVE